MTGNHFKLAMAQMRVDGGQKRANLARAIRCIGEAANGGAAVVLLPEALSLGWTHRSARTGADAVPDGESCKALRDSAKAHRVFVCAGLVERAGDRIFNSAVLIDPAGEVILHHRKINELEIARELYAPGDRLAVVDTPLGCIGVMICADAFVPGQVISRALGLMGANLILSPCAWAVPSDHDNARDPYGQLWRDSYGPVARDFKMWIAGASSVGPITDGPWQGRKCIGCSLLVGPRGEPMLQGPYGEGAEVILYAEIELKLPPSRGDGGEKIWSRS